MLFQFRGLTVGRQGFDEIDCGAGSSGSSDGADDGGSDSGETSGPTGPRLAGGGNLGAIDAGGGTVAGCQQPAIIAAHIITRAEARRCLTAVLRDGPRPRFLRGSFPSIPRGFEG